jgi:hypothetical protein
MKRKTILATVLCLAVAALGIGAAPALAADGCTCHTDATPTATPAHVPFVASVTDCTTCHVGWVVPHAAFLKPVPGFKPFMTIKSDGSVDCVVGGRLAKPNRARTGINGIVVYLQERAAGAGEFTDIGQDTTHHPFFFGPNGTYRLVIDSTAKGTVYRAVAQGAARSTIVVPVSATARMQPALELWRMRGLDNVGHVRRGRSVVAIGRAAPSWFVGEKVKLTLKKGPDGNQRVVRRVERRIRDGGTLGTFRWKITFHKRGEYALYARWPRTADHPAVSAVEWWFTVK